MDRKSAAAGAENRETADLAMRLELLSVDRNQSPVVDEARLVERVADFLVSRILDGTYPQGELLPSEQRLALAAGVSRLTVREAVRILRVKNVLRVCRGRGTMVEHVALWSPLDEHLLIAQCHDPVRARDLAKQLMQMRQMVEVELAGLAAERAHQLDLAPIEDALQRMRSASSEDVAAFSAADMAFHDAIMEAAGNPLVMNILQPLRALLREVRQQTSTHQELRQRTVADHARILSAVAAGDAIRARRAMRKHLAFTSAVLADEHSFSDTSSS